jgi:hypothetical protein
VEFWRYRLISIQAPLSLGVKMAKSVQSGGIPTELSLEQFRQFVLPHLTVGRRGPAPKLSLHALFNYILRLLYPGCQWKELPIAQDAEGRPRNPLHPYLWRLSTVAGRRLFRYHVYRRGIEAPSEQPSR